MAPHRNLTRDMTYGRPLPLILGFALPLIFGNLFQQMYSMVDTIIVGRYLGVDALAAVGSVGSLQYLIIGFCLGSCAGMAIPIAQAFGAKDEVRLRKSVASAAWLAGSMAILMTIITCILCRHIIRWINTPADIYDEAFGYLIVILLGLPATVLYNMCSAVMRALGDSKRPLYFLMMSSGINIVLDLVFIIVFKLGCTGAALATVISQLISGLCCLLYMKKNLPIVHVRKEEWKPDFSLIGRIASMGFPMGLQNSITAIGNVVLSSAVNSLGAIAVASMTAAGKVNMMYNCAYDAMGNAMATYCGQNLGARKLSRIGKGLKLASITMVCYSIVGYVLLHFFGTTVALLFVSPEETEILNNVHTFLSINSAFCWMLVFVINVRYSIQGLGYSRYAVFAGIFEMVARSSIAFFLVPALGFVGACFANCSAWVAANAFLIPLYLFVMKKLRRTVEEVPDDTVYAAH